MAILNSTPLKTGFITNLYTATHPAMGEGVVIETIRAYRGNEPQASDKTSVRFFPEDISRGALYSGQRSYNKGELVNEMETEWALESLEVKDVTGPEDYMSVNDFNEFADWDWDTDAVVEVDDNDPYRWRLHVTVTHFETRGRRVLVRKRTFKVVTDWVTAPSQLSAEELLRKAFKAQFFAKWQGCTLFMKQSRRYNNS